MSSPLPDGRLPVMPLEFFDGADVTHMVVVPPAGGTSSSYKTGPAEQIVVQAVSFDFAMGPVAEATVATVTVLDAAGNVVAVFQTVANTVTDQTSQVTFGAGLPDTRAYANDLSDVNAQSAMPPVALEAGGSLHVELVGSNPTMGELRLWVEDLTQAGGRSRPLPPLLAHRALAGA